MARSEGWEEFYRTIAAHYDEDYAALNRSADVEFYVAQAVESGGPVLEMGCGTGRVLLPTARAGIRIHGLELSPEMLVHVREKLAAETAEVRQRATLSQGDMRSAELGEKFALVTCPFRVVQHLLDRDSQRAWLRNVRRHLRPGGILCFDVFQPDYRLIAAPSGPTVELDRTDPATGYRVRRISSVQPKPVWQQQHVRFRWIVEDASGETVSDTSSDVVIRWFTRGELENLLELEGFRIIDYWGSFIRDEFGEDATDQVIRAVVQHRQNREMLEQLNAAYDDFPDESERKVQDRMVRLHGQRREGER